MVVRHDNPPVNTNWMDPLNRMIWHNAFINKQTHVTIRDGRRFVVNYDVGKLKSVLNPDGGGEQLISIHPDSERFVPCGEFLYKEVTNPVWIYDVA